MSNFGSTTKERAEERLQYGLRILKRWFFPDKLETAVEAFQKAANLYRMIKHYKKAAECYKLMVSPYLQLDQQYDAAISWLSCAQNLEKASGNEEEYFEAYSKAVDLFLEVGKFVRAARAEEKLGDILSERDKFEEAIQHYQKGELYFDNGNQKCYALDCEKKVAHLLALLGKSKEASEKFVSIAQYMLENKKCQRWCAKEFFFKAILCQLIKAGEDIDEELPNIKDNCKLYKEEDRCFKNSDYWIFLKNIFEAIENENLQSFTVACRKFDEKMDEWTVKISLKIKINIKKAMNSIL